MLHIFTGKLGLDHEPFQSFHLYPPLIIILGYISIVDYNRTYRNINIYLSFSYPHNKPIPMIFNQ